MQALGFQKQEAAAEEQLWMSLDDAMQQVAENRSPQKSFFSAELKFQVHHVKAAATVEMQQQHADEAPAAKP